MGSVSESNHLGSFKIKIKTLYIWFNCNFSGQDTGTFYKFLLSKLFNIDNLIVLNDYGLKLKFKMFNKGFLLEKYTRNL